MLSLKKVADDLAASLINPAPLVDRVAAEQGIRILRAVHEAVRGYADPVAEVRQLSAAIRSAAITLSHDPSIVTTEPLDRAASILAVIATAMAGDPELGPDPDEA